MTKKMKIIKLTVLVCILILSNIFILQKANLSQDRIEFHIELQAKQVDEFQIFFSVENTWEEESSQKFLYDTPGRIQQISVKFPYGIDKFRFDFGTRPQEIEIQDIYISMYRKKWNLWNKDNFQVIEAHQLEQHQDKVSVKTVGNDSYLVFEINPSFYRQEIELWYHTVNKALKILLCLVVDLMILLVAVKSKSVILLLTDLSSNKMLIWNLAKNDFKTKYAGSYLGIIWAFINPIITILIYWFVFSYGLKAGSPVEGVPFILWFIAGLIPWFFFQDALVNSTNCMIEYSYLVKKVVFKISVLPIIKILSSLFVHVVFIVFLLLIAVIYGVRPSIIILQLIYYSLCTFFLVLGIAYATSAIVLFFKDLSQIISILLQIGMWMTPIMWSYTIMPEKYQWIVKLNPFFYIVEGYRDTLLVNVWFWERYFQTAYFWIIALTLFGTGALIFKKLKPHFSDVL